MTEDISKKTVAVLLLLAIVLSITGTWLALTMEPVVVKQYRMPKNPVGEVSFRVGYPDVPEPSIESGQVTLKKTN